jgi:hypothetical protein
MFGMYSKKDLQRILAAAGTSLEGEVQAGRMAIAEVIDSSQRRIDKNRSIIAEAQGHILNDSAALREAQITARLLESLGV